MSGLRPMSAGQELDEALADTSGGRTMTGRFPDAAMQLTHILVVAELERSVAFYRDVLGAELVREYGGTSAVFSFNGAWLLLVTGGGPTADKPDVTFATVDDPGRVSHAMTIRVSDCAAAYEILRVRGAEFLTPPVVSDWEVRGFFRDPDGHLLEISESRG
jgi:catechol 2,3-dioxygenase-like lactoylglutathione lyase family enzyme